MTKLDVSCPHCKSRGLVFYEQRRILSRDEYSEYGVGLVSCPACGREELSMVPPEGVNLKRGERTEKGRRRKGKGKGDFAGHAKAGGYCQYYPPPCLEVWDVEVYFPAQG